MCFGWWKKLTKVRNNIFLIRRENIHIFPMHSPLFPSLSLLFPESRKPNPRIVLISIDALEENTAGLQVPRISSPLSTLQDPATNWAFVAADPSLQDPGSNLTFTLLVNGFLSKDRTVPSSLTDFSLFFSFFFFFCFPHQSGKPPIFLFFVYCWNNIWFTIQTYTPYIHEIF